MPDGEYAYLVARFLTEQARAHNASCREAAAIHQQLANAYQQRLRTSIPILDLGSNSRSAVSSPFTR